MKSLIITKTNFKSFCLCWGCNKTDEIDIFCQLQYDNECLSHSICIDCYENNKNNKFKECINCDGGFLLDYTKLTKDDKIKYGFDEFLYCYNCLSKKDKKCIGFYGGLLDELDNKNYRKFDTYNEDGEIEPTFKNINDRTVRIIGETIYNFNEETNNIKKKISNCIHNDTINFKIAGDITRDYIYELLQRQNYKCYICDEYILTTGYKPYCCNQFSIDRINNTKPHNKNNVKISCYFCNCKDHYLCDKKEKICDKVDCNCHNLLN